MAEAAHRVSAFKRAFEEHDIYGSAINSRAQKYFNKSPCPVVGSPTLPGVSNGSREAFPEEEDTDTQDDSLQEDEDQDKQEEDSGLEDDDDDNSGDLAEELVEESVLPSSPTKQALIICWERIVSLIKAARDQIPASKRLYHPLWYYIIDHTCQHTPTSILLQEHLPDMVSEVRAKIAFEREKLSEQDATFLRHLIDAEDYDLIHPENPSQRRLKECFTTIMYYIRRPGRRMSEMEYISRSLMPFLDATFDDPSLTIGYGELCLASSAEGRDPLLPAKAGYKTDFKITFQGLLGGLKVAVGEVSGGLPKCTLSKQWRDKIKLTWELRDMWYHAQTELNGVDITNVPFWGIQDVALKVKLFALIPHEKLFHLVLVDEVWKPSSKYDLCNIQPTIELLSGFRKKVSETISRLLQISQMYAQSGLKRKAGYLEQQGIPIIHTPSSRPSASRQKSTSRKRRSTVSTK